MWSFNISLGNHHLLRPVLSIFFCKISIEHRAAILWAATPINSPILFFDNDRCRLLDNYGALCTSILIKIELFLKVLFKVSGCFSLKHLKRGLRGHSLGRSASSDHSTRRGSYKALTDKGSRDDRPLTGESSNKARWDLCVLCTCITAIDEGRSLIRSEWRSLIIISHLHCWAWRRRLIIVLINCRFHSLVSSSWWPSLQFIGGSCLLCLWVLPFLLFIIYANWWRLRKHLLMCLDVHWRTGLARLAADILLLFPYLVQLWVGVLPDMTVQIVHQQWILSFV